MTMPANRLIGAVLLAFWLGASTAAAETVVLKPSQVNSDLKKYDGQILTVEGILFVGDPRSNHLNAIYNSRLRSRWENFKVRMGLRNKEKNPDKACLNIINPDMIWDMTDHPLHRRAKLKGEFVAAPTYEELPFGGCAIETGFWLEEVIELEGVPAKPSATPAP